MIKKVDKHMKFLKATLAVSVIFQVTSVFAIGPTQMKLTVGGLGALAAANAGRVYKKHTEENMWAYNYTQRNKWTGAAVALGAGATAATACLLHRRLPISRLVQGRQTLGQLKSYPLAQNFKTPQDLFNRVESWYLYQKYPYVHAFNVLREKRGSLSDVRESLARAKKDFEFDGDTGGAADCEKVIDETNELEELINSSVRYIKQRSDFGERAERYDRVQAAKQQAKAAEDTASNTGLIAAGVILNAGVNASKHG